MKTKMLFCALFATVLIAGCGTGRSTGAMQIGPDTYRIIAIAPHNIDAQNQKKLLEKQTHIALL
jgi:hypothetical protein